MAAIAATTSAVFTKPRMSTWPAVNTARLGARAATVLARHTPAKEMSSSRRRPRRSAMALATRAMSTPNREMARAVPNARSEAANDFPT